MRINTNVASMNAQENATNTAKTINSSLEKLSSGLRINKAADDASGLAIADKLRTQASSLKQGIANANSASALIQIADKAMAEQSNILDIVKQKLIQAGTSTTSSDGREAIRKDINKLLTQFDNIAAQTNYNGTTLLQKSATDTSVQDQLSFQLGEDDSFDVNVQLSKASNTKSLGGGADSISTGTVLDGQESKYLKDTGNALTLAAKQFDSTQTLTSTVIAANALDINISGDLGMISNTQVGPQTITIDLSSQSQEVKDLVLATVGSTLDAAADPGVTNASFDASTGVLTIQSTTAVNLSGIEISDAQLTINNGAGCAASVKIDESEGFSVKNNDLAAMGADNHELEITTDSGTTSITGGDILDSIKSLAADGLTADKANAFMTTIDEALSQMNANRSDFGSTQNQLESSIRNMQTTQTNLKAAESVIRDVDYAAESANFNKQNIIAQAGTYAMSQANAMQQNVMRLLQ
jgi:flagellin